MNKEIQDSTGEAMPTKKVHKVSVREIVDFIMRSGDITSVSLSDKRMSDGTKAHQRFQKEQMELGNYESEVYIQSEHEVLISHTSDIFEIADNTGIVESMSLMLSGRIDGVVAKYGDERYPLIDEIKSTSGDLSYIDEGNRMHWAQVTMYGYMYCLKHNKKIINLRLTYIELESFLIKQFVKTMTLEQLQIEFERILHAYVAFASLIDTFEHKMRFTINELQFPFMTIREGQNKLMKGVYRTIKEGQILFSRAPTGIGKTIATLFPSIKAIGEGLTDKVFYLTAKNIGKEVAVQTINTLQNRGLSIKYVVITAKEKICIHSDTRCNPDSCPYARGHFDRVNEALEHLYKEEDCYTRDVVTRYAILYRLCPYELSLDLSLFSQVIVCDYNYAFDPSAMLRRFFVEGEGRYTLLVDEAHNLVDRARSMYSAELEKSAVMELKKLTKELDQGLYGYFDKLNKCFVDMRKEMKDNDKLTEVTKEQPLLLETYLRGVIYRTEKIFKLHKNWEHMEVLLEFYFLAYDFIKKYEIYGPNYVTYYERNASDLRVKLFCVDPRPNLISIIDDRQGVIYFSATLTPMEYYRHLLGGEKESYGLNLPSPFESDKLKLCIDGSISTKYADRERSIKELMRRVHTFVSSKRGNYLIYFPSYKYLESGLKVFNEVYAEVGMEILVQQRSLREEEKEAFIEAFSHEDANKTLVAFAVLGGMFGEGIDLVGEKLSGAVVVGVGLPQINFEQDIIKDYFEELMGTGFDFAYVYPGMNKVMQAAGRVIRTTEDVGAVLLIDRRFYTRQYDALYPDEWYHRDMIRSNDELAMKLARFWRN